MSEEIRKKELRKPISDKELERRFKAVRKAMEKEKLDCLIMQNNNQFLGGYTRYFTGIPAVYSYTMTVIFPLNTEMTIISHGGQPCPPTHPEGAGSGVKKGIGLPYIR